MNGSFNLIYCSYLSNAIDHKQKVNQHEKKIRLLSAPNKLTHNLTTLIIIIIGDKPKEMLTAMPFL